MMRLTEAVVFLSLAMGLHVGLFGVAPLGIDAPAPGAQDDGAITLTAAAPAQAELARNWTQAPDLAVQTSQPQQPRPQIAPHQPQAAETVPALPAAPRLAQPHLPQLPDRGEAPPPAPEMDARRASAPAPADTRPKARPTSTAARRAETAPRATRDPSQAAPPRAARQKPGSGAQTVQSADAAQTRAAQAEWGAHIQRRVHRRLAYPRGASGSGVVQVALTVTRAGNLTGLQITGSSGVAAFDAAALKAVRSAAQFPPAPAALTRASYTFTLALAFRP